MKRSRTTVMAAAALAAAFALSCGPPHGRAGSRAGSPEEDWLVRPDSFKALVRADGPDTVHLENGLVRRTFLLRPGLATVDYQNLASGEAILRALSSEAILRFDGTDYPVGGLAGSDAEAYIIPGRLGALGPAPGAFRFRSYETGPIKERFPWKRKRPSEGRPWPPPGVTLTFRYDPPEGKLAGVAVSVIYELYDGIPLLSKRLVVTNAGAGPAHLDSFQSEILRTVEPESSVNVPAVWEPQSLHVESDYAFLADSPKTAARTTVWAVDPDFQSQVNYERKTPCLLRSTPPIGPDIDIAPGAAFESFTTWELAFDSTDRERRGLAVRRMYRTIAPWVTENPVIMHLRAGDSPAIRAAVDQCAATGFEMLILSFGSGLDMENEDPAYLARLKADADYAHARGVEIGGYSLLASRSVGPDTDVIDPKTGRPGGAAFGRSPCLESAWGREYFRKLRDFFEATGFDMLEHDGSYPGDVCASTRHAGHRGLGDSQWTQWREITDFYKWCRARGIYLNVPDWYFLSGSNKCAMGYRETNWSLPREQQIVLGRQNIFDGTWHKTPSMGWMFVPLVQYQGGGAAATIEPLAEHLDTYEAHLSQNFLSGVQACYRGTRLYDTDKTRAAVDKWVRLYKAHRDILDSDIIHLRRPDGRMPDGILHVNPSLPVKALAVLYNPGDAEAEWTRPLPLRLTGLRDRARVRVQDGPARDYPLNGDLEITVPVRIPARGLVWLTVE